MKTSTFFSKQFLILGLLLFHLQVFGQSIEWEANFGGAAQEFASQIQLTADDGYIIVGTTGSNSGDVTNNYGISDGWVVKLNAQGTIEWEVNLGGTAFDELRGIDQTTDGGYVIVGTSRSNNELVSNNYGESDIWVVKLDEAGTEDWDRNFGGSSFEMARSIQQTTDNGYIIGGGTQSTDGDVSVNKGESDAWIIKLNELGVIVWEKSFGGSKYEELYALDQTTDGGFVLTGIAESDDGDVNANYGGVDYWVLKLNSSGELEWENNFGGEEWDSPLSIIQTLDGGYMTAGYSYSTNGDISAPMGQADAWIVKLNATGDLEWEKSLGGSQSEFLGTIYQTNDGRYLMAGGSFSSDGDLNGNKGSSDYWLTRIDEQGELIWGKNYGGSKYDEVLSIEETADGGHILAGYTESNNGDISSSQGGMDMWIVKFMDLSTGVESPSLQAEIQLQPNPSHGNFTIVNNSDAGNLNIQIHSILGHLLHSVKSSQGNVEIEGLSNGIYMVSISDGQTTTTKRMIVH